MTCTVSFDARDCVGVVAAVADSLWLSLLDNTCNRSMVLISTVYFPSDDLRRRYGC